MVVASDGGKKASDGDDDGKASGNIDNKQGRPESKEQWRESNGDNIRIVPPLPNDDIPLWSFFWKTEGTFLFRLHQARNQKYPSCLPTSNTKHLALSQQFSTK